MKLIENLEAYHPFALLFRHLETVADHGEEW
jgi:hypothetical protein